MTTHPDYPPHNGDPQADRCVCGGIRHWHAVAPYGCDDCECTEFQSQAESDAMVDQNGPTEPGRLFPVESMSLTIAKAQLERGEDVEPNIATVLIWALIRITEQEQPA